MASTRTRVLLAASIFAGAMLFGGIADRIIVADPAWHRLGIAAWAEFSRHADLGNGLIAYPTEAIGATLLSIAAILSYHFDRPSRREAAIPLYLAAASYVVGLVLTIRAAPIMLGLNAIHSEAVPETAFREFHFWGLYLRGSIDGLALVAGIWALARLRPAD